MSHYITIFNSNCLFSVVKSVCLCERTDHHTRREHMRTYMKSRNKHALWKGMLPPGFGLQPWPGCWCLDCSRHPVELICQITFLPSLSLILCPPPPPLCWHLKMSPLSISGFIALLASHFTSSSHLLPIWYLTSRLLFGCIPLLYIFLQAVKVMEVLVVKIRGGESGAEEKLMIKSIVNMV